MKYRKLPARFVPYASPAARLVNAHAPAELPDWAPLVLAWQQGDAWTVTTDEAEQTHNAGGAVIWVSRTGVSSVTTATGAVIVGPGDPPPAMTPPERDAPYALVAPWLPKTVEQPGGETRTRAVMGFTTSTQWPLQAEWTSPTRKQLRIINPPDSGQNLHVGEGRVDNPNHQGQNDVVPPGSEWVSDEGDTRPVFARGATEVLWGIIESRKDA